MKPLRAPARDALIAALGVGIAAPVIVHFDGAERITAAALRWERFQLDDLLLSAGLAILALGWFAWRRWRDAARELVARRRIEQENARYLQRLEQLSSQLLAAEQDARTRLSELLHDEVGQTLYASRLQLERLEARLQEAACRALLEDARQQVDEALARTRDLTLELHPPVLHDLGLGSALQWLAERTEQRAQLPVHVAGGAIWNDVPDTWHAAIFQSVRELVANAVKHARASRVDITVERGGDGRLRISVSDDGCGFVYARDARSGFGLFSTERRLAWLGASLQVDSTLQRGTSVTLQLPVSA
ncbi:MAG TPA: sensor histidine kinase [Polyangiales bacterium]|nr:sensor histidine kinase [Polyangiales bacterium]